MKTNAKATCFSVCLSAWLGLAAAPAAHAQFNMGDPIFTIPTLVLNTGNAKDAHDKPASNTTLAASTFAYTPTPDLKAKTVQGYVDRLQPKNPAAAQAVAANFGPGKHDYGQVYHTQTKDSGLRENDAASATASFMVLGYMVVNNVQDGEAITVPMAQGVRAQVATRLAATPQLVAPGVPARLGEEMKLQFVIVQGGWQAASKEHTLSAYQQGIAAMFKNQYGLDLAKLQLTDQGFASKAGAVGAPGAAVRPAAGAPATASAAPAGSGAAGGGNWFFRAISGNGGGVAFEPVVLFANGTYCEAGDAPVETLAPAADRAARPRAWGT